MPLLAQGRKLVHADSFGCGPTGYTEQVIYITGLEALLAAGLDEEARDAAARRMSQTEAKGGLAHLACSGCYPPRCAFYAGEWTAAASEFARMLTIAEETHQPRYQWFAHAFLAQIAAARGDAVGCRAHSDAADACRDATPQLIGVTLGAGATGLLALSRGDCSTAVDIYEREVLPRVGQLLLWQEIADAAEAYACADRRLAAEKLLVEFEAQATASGLAWARAGAAHLRGLLAARASSATASAKRSNCTSGPADRFHALAPNSPMASGYAGRGRESRRGRSFTRPWRRLSSWARHHGRIAHERSSERPASACASGAK